MNGYRNHLIALIQILNCKHRSHIESEILENAKDALRIIPQTATTSIAGMWVRAIERMPDGKGKFNKVIVRDGDYITYGFRNFSDENPRLIDEQHGAILSENSEWLDESVRCDQAEAEALRFGEFLKAFAPLERERHVYVWWDKVCGGKHYTTSELYKLFKEQLKPE